VLKFIWSANDFENVGAEKNKNNAFKCDEKIEKNLVWLTQNKLFPKAIQSKVI